jgi:MFS family permease
LIHGILIFIGLLLLAFIPSNTSMLAGAGLLGLCYSVATVGTVMLCKTMFGIENYSSVYPKISMGTTLANAAGASIIGYLYDFTGSYLIALYLIMAMVAVSMIIIAK